MKKENEMEKLVNLLIYKNKTISSMESCTGGCFVDEVTNIPNASNVIKFSAITYSNEYKIKMGVNKDTINKYSVYSINTAKEMSKKISEFALSNYGVGITGRINREDKNNIGGNNNIIYVSIYDRDNDKYVNLTIDAIDGSREDNKKIIVNSIVKILLNIV